MEIEQANLALKVVREMAEGGETTHHWTWGPPVRNYARHWGCAFPESDLESHWWVLLKAGATLRLDPSFIPNVESRQTRPTDDEMRYAESWVAHLPVPNGWKDTTAIVRVFEFYRSEWYAELLSNFKTGEKPSRTILQFGHFQKGDGYIAITATEFEGEPLPAGGVPEFLALDEEGRAFVYCDYLYKKVGVD